MIIQRVKDFYSTTELIGLEKTSVNEIMALNAKFVPLTPLRIVTAPLV